MWVTLVGLNHKTAGLEVREKVRFSSDRLPEVLQKLRKIVPDAVVLSTCNRFEIVAQDATPETLIEFISQECGIARADFESCLCIYEDAKAVHQQVRGAARLDSMVVGEAQILGQMKQAFAVAREEGLMHGVRCTHCWRKRSVSRARCAQKRASRKSRSPSARL